MVFFGGAGSCRHLSQYGSVESGLTGARAVAVTEVTLGVVRQTGSFV